ncbi:hypothetical protein [Capillimicrobium parvum]|uniref:Uncharacterized protein n=1 Tax=Capillimicrobium parvum TaxID=2884022 RepID=A0A9E6XYG8_9ACTN|nr:hypothetical protein [Capillimicrobium parvum]UGS36565.1 hypothetical protein DSM104329_02972 [Capillimicrobium parvum]
MSEAPSPATEERARRPHWRARLRLGLAEAARTTPGRLGLLGGMVVAVWLVTAAVAALADVESSYGMALWSGLRHLFDPGSLGDDKTTPQRIVGVLQVFTGLIFLAGVAFTVLAETVDQGLRKLSESEPPVTVTGHLLVIGAGDVRAALLTRLDGDRGDPPIETVVVLAPSAADAVPHAKRPYHLVTRTGDGRDAAALADAGATAARAIVVLTGESSDTEVADLTALECVGALVECLDGTGDGSPLVAVHIEHARNVDAVWPLLPEAFDAVPGDRNVGAILALGVTLPDYPSLLGSATGSEGSEPFVVPAGDLAGAAFAEALGRCAGGLPLGLLRDGRARYAPEPDERITATDSLIVLAPDRAAAQARRAAPEIRAAPGSLHVEADPRRLGRVLVLGWSEAGDDLLAVLGGGPADLTVVAQLDAAPAGLAPDRLRAGDPGDPAAIGSALTAVDPEIVIILAGANGGTDPAGTHARAALAALKVVTMTDRPDLTIAVEQHLSGQAQRLRRADPRIRVISRAELVAYTLLLSATDRPALVAREAFGMDSALTLDAVHVTGSEALPFPAVYTALLAQGCVPLTMSRDGDEVDLLSAGASTVRPGDGLLVLRRAGPNGADAAAATALQGSASPPAVA